MGESVLGYVPTRDVNTTLIEYSGLILPNILICGSLYTHTGAKIMFVRIFRGSRHLHSHTLLSWTVWVGLLVAMGSIGFVLAIAVPVSVKQSIYRALLMCTVLLIPHRYRCGFVRVLVYIRPGWSFLAS